MNYSQNIISIFRFFQTRKDCRNFRRIFISVISKTNADRIVLKKNGLNFAVKHSILFLRFISR